jgi:peptide/nickel transport system permease protein
VAAESTAAALPPQPTARRRLALRRFRRDPIGMLSLGFVLFVFLLVFVIAPISAFLVGHGPNDLNPHAGGDAWGPIAGFWTWVPAAPGYMPHRSLYILGADGTTGRDAFLRLLYGGQITLEIALIATVLSVFVGAFLGGVAGYYGGRIAATIGWFTDLAMTFPFILFGVALWTTIGPKLRAYTMFGIFPRGVLLLAIVIAAFSWFYPMRITRIQVLSLRDREFVEAARMIGASEWRILRSHILPHLAAPLLGFASIAAANAMIAEAGLAWLGLRVPIPEASWGGMLADNNFAEALANTQLRANLWIVWMPVIFIFTTVVALNLFGDGVRAAFDPRSRR